MKSLYSNSQIKMGRGTAAHVKEAITRGKVQKGVPYLAILPFNGCPLLAVGSVEIGSRKGDVTVCYCFPTLKSLLSLSRRKKEPTQSVTTSRGSGSERQESLRSPLEAATQVSLTLLLRALAGSSHPWRTICGPAGSRADNTWLGSR